jgi:catalase
MPEQLYEDVIDAFEALFGKHPGFRRAHAKGVVCEGTFSPASAAVDFCRAPHLQGPPVSVTGGSLTSPACPNCRTTIRNRIRAAWRFAFKLPVGLPRIS